MGSNPIDVKIDPRDIVAEWSKALDSSAQR